MISNFVILILKFVLASDYFKLKQHYELVQIGGLRVGSRESLIFCNS